MNLLIQDLLDVTLVESGQLKLDRSPLTVRDLLVEVVDVQRPLASSSQVELALEVTREAREVLGDHDRLLRVFENLIGNAIKFTPPGGRIEVGAERDGDDVLFWVSDTGCGIAPEDLPHIFDRFWRATEHAGRLGAGLGLSIAKGIVEAHGGRIWAESTPGRGSRFCFSIPSAHQPADQPLGVMH